MTIRPFSPYPRGHVERVVLRHVTILRGSPVARAAPMAALRRRSGRGLGRSRLSDGLKGPARPDSMPLGSRTPRTGSRVEADVAEDEAGVGGVDLHVEHDDRGPLAEHAGGAPAAGDVADIHD